VAFFFNGKSVDKIITNKKEEERFEAFLSVQDPVDSNFLLEKTPALATSKPAKCENKHMTSTTSNLLERFLLKHQY